MRKTILVIALSLWCTSLWARLSERPWVVRNYFELLKDLPVDLSSHDSAIEEEIVRLELYKRFPADRYVVEKNLGYFDVERQLGELDAVVIEIATGAVVFVGEVKRQKHAGQAVRKGHEQLDHLRYYLNQNQVRSIYDLAEPTRRFPISVFEGGWVSEVIGVKTGDASRYDWVIDLTPSELQRLREQIVAHQQKVYARSPRRSMLNFKQFWKEQTAAFYQDSLAAVLQRMGCAFSFQ